MNKEWNAVIMLDSWQCFVCLYTVSKCHFSPCLSDSRSQALSPFDTVRMTSYSPYTEAMYLSCTVFKI